MLRPPQSILIRGLGGLSAVDGYSRNERATTFSLSIYPAHLSGAGGSKVLTPHELRLLLMRYHPTFAAITIRDVDLVCSFVFVPVTRAPFPIVVDRLPCSCELVAISPINQLSTLSLVDPMALS